MKEENKYLLKLFKYTMACAVLFAVLVVLV